MTPSDLATAGVDLASIDPRTFAMSSMKQPVAIKITGGGGRPVRRRLRDHLLRAEVPGHAISGEIHRRTGVLAGGRRHGRPAHCVDRCHSTGQPDAAPGRRGHGARSRPAPYWNLNTLAWVNITQETWFWARLQPTAAAPATAALSYEVPDPAPGTAATFRLQALPRYAGSASAQPAHRTTVALNNKPLLDQTWSGSQVALLTAAIAPGVLVNGLNTALVGAQVMPGNYTDDVYFPYWEVDYRREFRARQGRFDFRAEAAGTHEYAVDGWTSNQVVIWDISNPGRPRWLAVANSVSHRLYLPLISSHRAAQASEAAWFWTKACVFGRMMPRAPITGSRLRAASTLPHRSASGRLPGSATLGAARIGDRHTGVFLPAAERLAAWHHDRGRRTVIADLQDVYDEFNDGTEIAPRRSRTCSSGLFRVACPRRPTSPWSVMGTGT